ncbi:MAG: hypothetical protein K5894_16125 [Lachnospiraceae bacterium]|nr:hypothetical protein [Lachnospiraceae bacterium]
MNNKLMNREIQDKELKNLNGSGETYLLPALSSNGNTVGEKLTVIKSKDKATLGRIRIIIKL